MRWMDLLAGHKGLEVRYNFEKLYPHLIKSVKWRRELLFEIYVISIYSIFLSLQLWAE
jgi:hypothetical protein